jgi:esterase/lipase superfamily enzyme
MQSTIHLQGAAGLDVVVNHAAIAGALLFILSGCAGTRLYQVPFMPPPAFLESAEVTPFTDPGQVNVPADPRILYVTLREPVTVAGEDRFYTSERAAELRLGAGRIVLGASDVTWDEARRLSILKNNTDRYPLQVADVTEFGVLDRTLHPILHMGGTVLPDPAPRQAFSAAVNTRLAQSKDKDIFIYVHGYRVNFENPLLVGAELWHFLGYQGVFIPFAWPSHRGRLAYFGDTESARYSAIFLREFIEYLAAETDARRIHILGYSAGTRLVLAALNQLALTNQHRTPEDIRRDLRLGNVILVGSDVDRGIFGTYLLDGLLRVQEHMTVYESGRDKALGMALFTFRNERVGQLDPDELTPQAKAFLRGSDELALVSVEAAPGFDHGNGHSYFRDSPWVSSDLLATLLYDLRPKARGLVQDGESGIWNFPPDYLARIEAAVFSADPELARRARGL